MNDHPRTTYSCIPCRLYKSEDYGIGIYVIYLSDLLDILLPEDKRWTLSYEETGDIVEEWCATHHAITYEDVKERFNEWEGVARAIRADCRAVVCDNLS